MWKPIKCVLIKEDKIVSHTFIKHAHGLYDDHRNEVVRGREIRLGRGHSAERLYTMKKIGDRLFTVRKGNAQIQERLKTTLKYQMTQDEQ